MHMKMTKTVNPMCAYILTFALHSFFLFFQRFQLSPIWSWMTCLVRWMTCSSFKLPRTYLNWVIRCTDGLIHSSNLHSSNWWFLCMCMHILQKCINMASHSLVLLRLHNNVGMKLAGRVCPWFGHYVETFFKNLVEGQPVCLLNRISKKQQLRVSHHQ